MIIWINGTFGSGKTTTAYELHKRLPNSFVYDPERFGYVLMKNVPQEIAKDDFQDYPLWRESNYALLKQVTEQYKGTIIVPMTVTDENYFKDMIGNLRNDGIIVKHFTLLAAEEVIHKRLRKRFEGKNSWAYGQVEKRMKLLAADVFQEQIQTDNLSVDQVVETVANLSGVELRKDSRTKFKKGFDRTVVSLKEIGIFK